MKTSHTAAAVFRRRVTLLCALVALMLLTNGCVYWPREIRQPITTSWSPVSDERQATLIVFLPGRGDTLHDFERKGMIEELRRAGVRADWVSVDAHLGYYRDRSVVTRLREDVIEPARAQGYRRIIVVGVSLGGLGGLLIEREERGLIDGLVLLAPYLGDDKKLFAEIRAQGGPAAWARAHPAENEAIAHTLWTYLGKEYTHLPPTWLAYGETDWLVEGHRLLAPLLPADRVKVIAGGHDWKTWRVLWRELCANTDLFPTNGTVAHGAASESSIVK